MRRTIGLWDAVAIGIGGMIGGGIFSVLGLAAVFLIFLAYEGSGLISNTAEEIENPLSGETRGNPPVHGDEHVERTIWRAS